MLTEAKTPSQGSYLNLFFISFVLLFLELSCIRWFGSTVVFLTFFTNIVLLATFLGMSPITLNLTFARLLILGKISRTK